MANEYKAIPADFVEWAKETTKKFPEDNLQLLAGQVGINLVRMFLRISDLNSIQENEHWEFGFTHNGEMNSKGQLRMSMLADMLLTLSDTSCFNTLCSRFRFVNFRASFFETIVSTYFRREGFDILVRGREGQPRRGEDFDFQARSSKSVINVEVTSLVETGDWRRSIRNSVEAKRKQLPKNEPGIIYCLLPQQWVNLYGGNLFFSMWYQANRILARTGRVNAVVFGLEQFYDYGEQGVGATFTTSPIINVQPRFPVDTSFLFFSGGWGREHTEIVKRPELEGSLFLKMTPSQVWVNELLLEIGDARAIPKDVIQKEDMAPPYVPFL